MYDARKKQNARVGLLLQVIKTDIPGDGGPGGAHTNWDPEKHTNRTDADDGCRPPRSTHTDKKLNAGRLQEMFSSEAHMGTHRHNGCTLAGGQI